VALQLACQALRAEEADIFSAAVTHWIATAAGNVPEDPVRQAAPAASPDLFQFARATRDAASASPSGRFGPNKVFISHVWQALRSAPDRAQLSLPEFKERLLAAHRQGLIVLSRADLVERMPREDLAASETTYFDAVFHFVCLN
jgi:hypothetical protein